MTGSSETVGVLCAKISTSLMFSHLAEFAKRVKLSGTAEELESFRYLKAVLDGYGYVTSLIQHDAYISLPGRALLEVAGETPRCITHSFSRSSPDGGLTGLVVYVGQGTDQDFAAADVKGRVVLVEGLATPAASLRASRAGALGQIHISPHEHLHEMCVSPVWGSPDTETVHMLPSTVVLTIARSAGGESRRGSPTANRSKRRSMPRSKPAGAPHLFSSPNSHLMARPKVPSCCSPGTTTLGITA